MREMGVRGFTLIEAMIVVVIIGVLAAIAYPSYQNYARQARRADAQSAITQIANRLEKFFTYCNSYPTSATPLTSNWPTNCPTAAATLVGTGLQLTGDLSPDQHYQITVALDNINGTCSAPGGPCNPLPGGLTLPQCQARCGYTITANPNGAGVTGRQRDDGRFRMDSSGVKQWDKGNGGSFGNKWTDK